MCTLPGAGREGERERERERERESLHVHCREQVVKDYSATFEGIGAAMAAAVKVLTSSRGDSCTLYFSEGSFAIEMPAALFNVSIGEREREREREERGGPRGEREGEGD